MNSFIIQLQRGEDWNKLSTVQYDPMRDKAQRVGDVTLYTREGALREAKRHLTSWQNHYADMGVRIIERIGYAGKETVVYGRKG